MTYALLSYYTVNHTHKNTGFPWIQTYPLSVRWNPFIDNALLPSNYSRDFIVKEKSIYFLPWTLHYKSNLTDIILKNFDFPYVVHMCFFRTKKLYTSRSVMLGTMQNPNHYCPRNHWPRNKSIPVIVVHHGTPLNRSRLDWNNFSNNQCTRLLCSLMMFP